MNYCETVVVLLGTLFAVALIVLCALWIVHYVRLIPKVYRESTLKGAARIGFIFVPLYALVASVVLYNLICPIKLPIAGDIAWNVLTHGFQLGLISFLTGGILVCIAAILENKSLGIRIALVVAIVWLALFLGIPANVGGCWPDVVAALGSSTPPGLMFASSFALLFTAVISIVVQGALTFDWM